jgi:hypothetical protein
MELSDETRLRSVSSETLRSLGELLEARIRLKERGRYFP